MAFFEDREEEKQVGKVDYFKTSISSATGAESVEGRFFCFLDSSHVSYELKQKLLQFSERNSLCA